MTKQKGNEKHKLKKLQRQEEAKKIVQEQALVTEAKKVPNPLELLSPAFHKYQRNGLDVQFECKLATEWDSDTQEWAFQITKRNMEELYGKEWKDKDKRAELLEETAQYLIGKLDGKPVAFSHFRFDMDFDWAVLYCYEIQLEEPVQRKGLGRFMMQLLELMAFQTRMKKVVLTVFHDNTSAMSFYKNKLGYVMDETSPSELESDWVVNYEILSKPIKAKKTSSPASAGTTANSAVNVS